MNTRPAFHFFSTPLPGAIASLVVWAGSVGLQAQPDPNWLGHDRTRPFPPLVDPGTCSSPAQPGRPPSDAVMLFNGKDLTNWAAMDGSATRWIVKDGAMECVPGSGYARTRQCFGDCQLHVEWATPVPPNKEGQGRGNSGVFFGLNRYEIQVLDSYESRTYADGAAGAVYGQYPPLVNASRPAGQWQSYDIVWTAPRFDFDGELLSPARVTVLHNGVLVQNNVELTGPTSWLERAPYQAHPEKLPISLQDHGNPVRYRNVWVRELGRPGKPEFMLADTVLDSYVGDYERGSDDTVKIRRAPDGLLSMTFGGATFLMHAGSPTHFFAQTTDVQCDFNFAGATKEIVYSVGEGEMRGKKK
jgi:hypothetical protein